MAIFLLFQSLSYRSFNNIYDFDLVRRFMNKRKERRLMKRSLKNDSILFRERNHKFQKHLPPFMMLSPFFPFFDPMDILKKINKLKREPI